MFLASASRVGADAQSEWEAALAAAAGQMVEVIPPGQTLSPSMQAAAAAELEALRQLLAQSLLDQPAREQAMDELAARLGTAREIVRPDGSKLILAGEMDGSPIWISNPESGMFASGTLLPVSAVPEPTSLWLLGAAGFAGVLVVSRRRARAHHADGRRFVCERKF